MPLYRDIPDPDPYPVDALGSILTPAAHAIVDLTQAPIEIAAQSVLALATLAAQGHIDVMLPTGQVRPVSCFFLTAAESGERKSAVDDYALRPAREYEKLLRADYDENLAVYVEQFDAWEAKRKQKADPASHDGPALKPEAPLKPYVTCAAPTFEAVEKLLLAEGQPSMGIFSGEGGRFIGGYSMKAENKLATATGLSILWDSGTVERFRSGDGSAKGFGRRFALHLMCQPDVARRMLSDSELMDQGLLSRVLVSAPKPKTGTRFWRDARQESHSALDRYNDRALELLKTPRNTVEGKPQELRPRVLELDAAARAAWIAFIDHNERQMGPGGDLAPIRGLANKLGEHAARIGAVLTLFNAPTATHITGEYIKAGIELAQYYGGEALRLFHASVTSVELMKAKTLLDWLQERYAGCAVGLRTIYQTGPGAIRDAKSAKAAMEVLVQHHRAYKIEGGAEIEGERCRDAWQIRGG